MPDIILLATLINSIVLICNLVIYLHNKRTVIKWKDCEFIGKWPKPYTSWKDFIRSTTKQNVIIKAK